MKHSRILLALALIAMFLAGGLSASAASGDPCNPVFSSETIGKLKLYEECRFDRIDAATKRIEAKLGTTPSSLPSAPVASPTVTQPGPSPTVGAGTQFPDAASTGAKGTRTAYTGPMTINTAGTIIDGKNVAGELIIRAADVVIRNSVVTSTDYYGVLVYGKRLLIEDSTFNGSTGTASIAATEGGQFVARRVNVSGGEDGVRLADGSTLEGSYVHDLSTAAGDHNDAVTADGYSGVKIIGNTILNRNGQTAAVWTGDPRYGASSVELRGNLLGGGGYSIYAGPGTSQIVGNQFTTRYFPKVGYYGLVASWTANSGIWSGNTYADGSNAGKPVNP